MFTGKYGRDIQVIGVPFSDGCNSVGVSLGPASLRAAGVVSRLRGCTGSAVDYGDIAYECLPESESVRMKCMASVSGMASRLSDTVYHCMEAGRMPVVLGGDHSVAIGSVNGVARYCKSIGRELFVLWLDAHGDFNSPATSVTGNAHGMPAALLSGEQGLVEILDSRADVVVDPRNICAFSVRWLDPAEQLLLVERGVSVVTMRDIDHAGIHSTLGDFMERVRQSSGLLHLSFDIDAVDPQVAPGVSTPEPGGLTLREANSIMEMLAECDMLCSVDLVEVNPQFDVRNKTSELAVSLLAVLFGQRIIDTRRNSLARDALTAVRYG